jgi:hypothetical protein
VIQIRETALEGAVSPSTFRVGGDRVHDCNLRRGTAMSRRPTSHQRLVRNAAFKIAAITLSAGGASAQYEIDLSLEGPTGYVAVGETVNVRLRAKSDATESLVGQSFFAIDCILDWNPKDVELMGLTTTGSVPMMSSYFPSPNADYTGINELAVPKDGDALYYAIANFGSPVSTAGLGAQVVTFRFKILRPFASTTIAMLPSLTIEQAAVYDGTVPGLDVVGDLVPATLEQEPELPEDLDGDGIVGAGDLSVVLSSWGAGGGPADIDGNGVVDSEDLARLLSSWGATTGAK